MSTRLRKFGGELGKLSRLQRFILSMFLDPEFVKMSDSQKNSHIYDICFGGVRTPSVRASVSRSWRRLERRGDIQRYLGAWMLTDGSKNMNHCGYVAAALVGADLMETAKALKKTDNG